jgi:hypothetical protein
MSRLGSSWAKAGRRSRSPYGVRGNVTIRSATWTLRWRVIRRIRNLQPPRSRRASRNSRHQPASRTVHDNFVRAAARAGSPASRIDEGGCPFDASTRLSPPNWIHEAFCPSDYPPDFLERGHASCQLPPLRSGTASPPAWSPSTSTSSLPIIRSVWTWARLTPMPRSSSSERPSGRSSKAPRIEAP